ncbi:serine protease [Paracoccus sp. S-4012]|uniref:trypsin-like serine peptidase n=1 Tax=Paracoccus sp. S-4012 TaxID=2665648 RepID=UPI0012B01A6C|nr:trypsin-like peptidase domain-containing protein [Paracoccus sp. S-4012]MRX51191.1 serine protease [Paracoccus sp. S-4012]
MAIPVELIEPLSRKSARIFTLQEGDWMLRKVTGDMLYEVVPRGLPDRATFSALLDAVSASNIEAKLLSEMLARRPNDPEFRDLVARASPEAAASPPQAEMPLSLQVAGAAVADAPPNGFAPGLQRNVRPNLQKLDLMVWVDKLLRIRNRVCRIEIGTRAAGTGFLVGPQAVLTNWHVVEKAATAGRVADLRCRFDYLMREDGARQPGVVLPLGDKALACHSPFSPAELTDHPAEPPPTPDELDFALLHLGEAAGEHEIEGVARRWIPLPAAAPALAPDDPLLIVQHPDGAPMKLAMDTQAVIGPNANGTRLRYRTNTDSGSSGSPGFSMDWDPVVLHHYGDPAWQAPKFNQGVPLHLVRARIEAGGQSGLLGP